MVHGQTPFKHLKTIHQKLLAIPNPNHKIKFPPLRNVHLQDVLQRCLEREPSRRPTIPELMQHALLRPEAASSGLEQLPQVIQQVAAAAQSGQLDMHTLQQVLSSVQATPGAPLDLAAFGAALKAAKPLAEAAPRSKPAQSASQPATRPPPPTAPAQPAVAPAPPSLTRRQTPAPADLEAQRRKLQPASERSLPSAPAAAPAPASSIPCDMINQVAALIDQRRKDSRMDDTGEFSFQ
jgi:serine/threonine-protein kinase TTK/MPS1